MRHNFSKIDAPVSLQTHLSCFLPPASHPASAVLNYLLSLELSTLGLSLECHSSPSHPPAPICLANIYLYFRAQFNLPTLQGFLYCAPPFTSGRTGYLLFGAPSPCILTMSVCLSWTANSLRTMSLSQASLYLDVQFTEGIK